jgi:MinD-like ATPase involved in chromosome partitioning or flagellar assembly/DNA-binding NarL/FixJ family response regulator
VADRGTRLAAQVTAALDGADPVPEVVACVEAANLEHTLLGDGPFHVLLAGPALATGPGLARLRGIAEELPEVSVVLALARRPGASLRELVQIGAVDLLQLPVDDGELAAALGRAVAMAREAVLDSTDEEDIRDDEDGEEDQEEGADAGPPREVAPAPPPQPEWHAHPEGQPQGRPDGQPAAEPPSDGAGRVVTVVSATGSTGRTAIATNLAGHLANAHAASVCLVDLDVRFGGVAAAMELEPEATISDLAERGPVDGEALAALVTRHPSGVDVLAAPADPAAGDAVTVEQVSAVLAAAGRAYEWVVCDTPPAMTELAVAAVERSDQVVVASLTDRASRRDLRTFLTRLQRMQVPASRVHLVFNLVDEHDPGTLPEAARIPDGATAEAFAAAFAGFLPPPPASPAPAEPQTATPPESPERPGRRRRLRRRRD